MIARLLAHLRQQWMGALALFLFLASGTAARSQAPIHGPGSGPGASAVHGWKQQRRVEPP